MKWNRNLTLKWSKRKCICACILLAWCKSLLVWSTYIFGQVNLYAVPVKLTNNQDTSLHNEKYLAIKYGLYEIAKWTITSIFSEYLSTDYWDMKNQTKNILTNISTYIGWLYSWIVWVGNKYMFLNLINKIDCDNKGISTNANKPLLWQHDLSFHINKYCCTLIVV